MPRPDAGVVARGAGHPGMNWIYGRLTGQCMKKTNKTVELILHSTATVTTMSLPFISRSDSRHIRQSFSPATSSLSWMFYLLIMHHYKYLEVSPTLETCCFGMLHDKSMMTHCALNRQIQVSWPSIIQEVWWNHGLQTLYGPDLGWVFFDHFLMIRCSFFATFFFASKSHRDLIDDSCSWCHVCWMFVGGGWTSPQMFSCCTWNTPTVELLTEEKWTNPSSVSTWRCKMEYLIPVGWFRNPAPVEICKCILYIWNPYKNWDICYICYINWCRISEPSTGATVDLGRLDALDFDKDGWLQVVAKAGRRLTTGPGQVDSPVPKLHKRSGAVFWQFGFQLACYSIQKFGKS